MNTGGWRFDGTCSPGIDMTGTQLTQSYSMKGLNMAEHTPLPWYAPKTDRSQGLVYQEKTGANIAVTYQGQQDAEFIERACNSYYDLLAALETVQADAEYQLYKYGMDALEPKTNRVIKAALAKARP